MLHTLDPYAISFGNGFGIRWYGLSYLAGFLSAYYIILLLARRGLSEIPQQKISDFIFAVALGTIIGGRLGYCIFYSPDLFLRFSADFPFWGVLAVNEGGMASHGGIAGIIVAASLYAKRHGFSKLHAVDLCALTGPVGVFYGRLANFVNGELVGRPASENLAWGVRFPQDILAWPTYEPERLLSLQAAVDKLGISAADWTRMVAEYRNSNAAWRSLNTALDQLILKVQSGNTEVAESLRQVLTLRHPSQLYEAGLEGLFLFIVLALSWRSAHRVPGMITGLFLTLYSVVRIIGEQFRTPDAHIGYQLLGLTRGQWLSIVMLILGLVFMLFVFKRRKA